MDLLLTDPPYNVGLGMDENATIAERRHRRTDGKVVANDKMEDSEFREFLTAAFLNAAATMKVGASFYIWHSDWEVANFRLACRDAMLQVRQGLVWIKNSLVLGRQDYQWKHEPCLYGWKPGGAHFWGNDRTQTTVLEFDRPTRSSEHPTMKPVALFDYLIKNSSKSGAAVLDLFSGSGTTIIACEQNGRVGYGMELDPRYCDAIIKRWEALTGEKAELLSEN